MTDYQKILNKRSAMIRLCDLEKKLNALIRVDQELKNETIFELSVLREIKYIKVMLSSL